MTIFGYGRPMQVNIFSPDYAIVPDLRFPDLAELDIESDPNEQDLKVYSYTDVPEDQVRRQFNNWVSLVRHESWEDAGCPLGLATYSSREGLVDSYDAEICGIQERGVTVSLFNVHRLSFLGKLKKEIEADAAYQFFTALQSAEHPISLEVVPEAAAEVEKYIKLERSLKEEHGRRVVVDWHYVAEATEKLCAAHRQ